MIGRIAQSKGVRQLVKFCVVGVSSLTVDFLVFNLLFGHVAPIGAIGAAFVAGVSNSFFWNSRWTFAGVKRDVKRQLPLFFATNFVGFLLSAGVTTAVLVIAAHLGLTKHHLPPMETLQLIFFRSKTSNGFSRLALNAAKICAAVVVMAWNFTASKFITFRHVTDVEAVVPVLADE